MRAVVALLLSFTAGAATASEMADSTTRRPHELKEVEVLGLKSAPDGANSAEAVTRIGSADVRRLGIDAVKDVSAIAPNFYMPDYGSRMTSSIYVRGLGARMDQPVVGLSIDNIPYLNKEIGRASCRERV